MHFPAGARPLRSVFSDSSITYILESKSIRQAAISRYVRDHPEWEMNVRISHFMDSCGFFKPVWDTVSADTIRVYSGEQFLVDSIIIKSAYPFDIDSIVRMSFPRNYDADEIMRLANRSVSFLTERGFPFAALSIVVDSGAAPGGSSQSAWAAGHMRIVFIIDTERKCRFGPPIFSGEFKTREKLISQDLLFSEGEMFDAKKVKGSERRLMSRNYIDDVQAGTPGLIAASDSGSSSGGEIEDSCETVAVPFLIRDKSGMGLDGALVYNSDESRARRFTGLFTVTMLNVFRNGESASVYYRGEINYQQFDVLLEKYNLFLQSLHGSAAFGLEIEEKNYGYLHGELKFLFDISDFWQAGVAFSGQEATDTLQSKRRFWGLDFILQRPPERFQAQGFARELTLRTGSGVADRGSKNYWRWNLRFSTGIHIPISRRQAIMGRFVAKNITTDPRDTLHAAEKFKVGGHNSIRGYMENQFRFKSIAYIQAEYLFYFSKMGSAYIFFDGGSGFAERLSLSSSRTDLFGYGVGIRIPVKIGSASIAWARNYKDTKGLGRIHVRIRNTMASDIKW